MASGHAGRQWLEVLKFTIYVTTPIAATIYLGTGAYPYLEKMIHKTAYVVYPPEGPTPPKGKAEIEKAREELKQKRTAASDDTA